MASSVRGSLLAAAKTMELKPVYPDRAGVATLGEYDLVPEIEADAAVADPADEGVDAGAMLEFDDDRLTEAGIEIAFDHGATRRDVDHRHMVRLAAKIEGGLVDDADMTLLASLLDEARLLPVDPYPHQPRLKIAHRPLPTSRDDHARNKLPNSQQDALAVDFFDEGPEKPALAAGVRGRKQADLGVAAI